MAFFEETTGSESKPSVSSIELTAAQYVVIYSKSKDLVTAGISSAAKDHFQGKPMKNLLVRFVKDRSGATAIEYGLIAAGISVAIIAVVNDIGSGLNGKFNTVSTQLK